MQPQFDILKIGKDGNPLWVEAAETLDAAKTRVIELLQLDPATEFVIFNQKNQETISVKFGCTGVLD
jgi:hypothetical protein